VSIFNAATEMIQMDAIVAAWPYARARSMVSLCCLSVHLWCLSIHHVRVLCRKG